MSERYEYDCVYVDDTTYQNALDDMASDGWRFVESISDDDIFIFERPVNHD